LQVRYATSYTGSRAHCCIGGVGFEGGWRSPRSDPASQDERLQASPLPCSRHPPVRALGRAKFWLKVMNELKTRGIGDILIAVVDSLNRALPHAEARRSPVGSARQDSAADRRRPLDTRLSLQTFSIFIHAEFQKYRVIASANSYERLISREELALMSWGWLIYKLLRRSLHRRVHL
jgi:hypothetical protein